VPLESGADYRSRYIPSVVLLSTKVVSLRTQLGNPTISNLTPSICSCKGRVSSR